MVIFQLYDIISLWRENRENFIWWISKHDVWDGIYLSGVKRPNPIFCISYPFDSQIWGNAPTYFCIYNVYIQFQLHVLCSSQYNKFSLRSAMLQAHLRPLVQLRVFNRGMYIGVKGISCNDCYQLAKCNWFMGTVVST